MHPLTMPRFIQHQTDNWSGGQYSLLRMAIGLLTAANLWPYWTLNFQFGDLLLALLGGLCCLALFLGYWHRTATIILVGFVLVSHSLQLENWLATLPLIGLLLQHLWLPPAPFLSLAGRRDPGLGRDWQRPATHMLACITALPVAALFCLVWPSEDTILPTLVLITLCINPGWLKTQQDSSHTYVFYDGDCGFCQACVKLLLAEDQSNHHQFAPLTSEYFQQQVPANQQKQLPASLLVQTNNHQLLTKSTAVIQLLWHLGGLWWLLGWLLWMQPKPLRNLGYDGVGKIRKRLMPTPEGTCPIVAPELAKRFRY